MSVSLACRTVVMSMLLAASAAVASASAPLSFAVSVNSSNAPGFTPTTFNQTVTINNWTPSPPVNLFVNAGNLLKSDNVASAVFSNTPYTASLLASIAPITGSSTLYAETGWYLDFSNGNGQVHLQQTSAQFYQSGPVWHYDVYNMEMITAFSLTGAGDVQSMTLPRIAQLLTQHNPLNWNQSAQRTVYDAPNGNQLSFTGTSYFGTATFLAVTPEPTSLSLLAVSAALTRRRRT